MRKMFMTASLQVIRDRFTQLVGLSHGGKRDLYQVFGYPREVTADLLYEMYLRGGIASRIIRAFPQATWRDEPIIRDEAGNSGQKTDARGKANENYSPFVEAVENFFEEHNLWRVIERADRLSGIGRFGIILLGFADGKNLQEPIDGKAKLIYASPYGEPAVEVTKWESDPKSPRFGLPVLYSIQQQNSVLATGSPVRTVFNVHYSRVLHIAEFLDSDECYGVPRLLPVYNDLLDLQKVVGGAAETFWLAANRGLALWADKEAVLDEDAIEEVKKQADEFQHQLRRYLVGSGMTAQVLGADSPDPGPNADRLIDLIAGATGIPKRILLGTERGELSSIQDENNWASRVDERRRHFASPIILKPLVRRLIDTGNLPEPEGVFWVEWPEIASMDPVQRATVAANKSTALANYVRSPGAELIVPPQEFRREFLELEPESEFEIEEPDDDLEEEEDDNISSLFKFEMNRIEDNAKPRRLYVRREVLNAASIKKWARAQGLTDLVKDMHVTLIYTKNEVDWIKAGQPWTIGDEGNLMIHPGGPRVVEEFDDGAIVLEFVSDELTLRHMQIKDQTGAITSYAEYRPHITLTYTKPDFDLTTIKPYMGAIALGPEIFEEADDSWEEELDD